MPSQVLNFHIRGIRMISCFSILYYMAALTVPRLIFDLHVGSWRAEDQESTRFCSMCCIRLYFSAYTRISSLLFYLTWLPTLPLSLGLSPGSGLGGSRTRARLCGRSSRTASSCSWRKACVSRSFDLFAFVALKEYFPRAVTLPPIF